MPRRRIALLISQDISFCRDVIRGIRAYALDRREWQFQSGPPEIAAVRALRHWQPQGMIASLLTTELAAEVRRLRIPVIDTSCTVEHLRVPIVDVDHQAVGRLAAEHFLERGYQRFGFFGIDWAYYSRLREAAFRQRLGDAGHQVSSCYAEYFLRVSALQEQKRSAGRIRRWLARLAKPAAIFACNDEPARDLADTCLALGYRVPDDVAILGVDNDDLACTLTSPPLSSVATPARQVGYEAARLLDCLLAGDPPPAAPCFLAPVGVVTRQSTDALAAAETSVVAAQTFIRTHLAEPIHVDDVAAFAVQSRRTLEYKFRRCVGHTILEEIRRARIGRVKTLLSDSDLGMPSIARQAGFSSAQRMARVFRQATGKTPSEYRRQTQVRGG